MDSAEQRFTQLYERHYDAVHRYVVRRVVGIDVADVTAEVFLVAWRRLADIPVGAELPWLYRSASFVLANEYRGQSRGQRLTERVAGEPDGRQAADHADEVVDRLAVTAAFDRLPSADQEVLRLVAWERCDPGAAAKALGCSRATFTMRLFRARRRLREQLKTSTATDRVAVQTAQLSVARRGG
jgi:RNA polymerase sigma-70 factor (ECF subfamily)